MEWVIGCYVAMICDEIFSASLDIKGITYISNTASKQSTILLQIGLQYTGFE
jgi:hypothetical protein